MECVVRELWGEYTATTILYNVPTLDEFILGFGIDEETVTTLPLMSGFFGQDGAE